MSIVIARSGLSERGTAILRLVGIPLSEGFSDREIAGRLRISARSVSDLVLELQDELRQLTL